MLKWVGRTDQVRSALKLSAGMTKSGQAQLQTLRNTRQRVFGRLAREDSTLAWHRRLLGQRHRARCHSLVAIALAQLILTTAHSFAGKVVEEQQAYNKHQSNHRPGHSFGLIAAKHSTINGEGVGNIVRHHGIYISIQKHITTKQKYDG
jgi:hypothetical protein